MGFNSAFKGLMLLGPSVVCNGSRSSQKLSVVVFI